VAAERTSGSGLHGGIQAAEALRCAQCHADHQGRDFAPASVALVNFDHTVTGFPLDRHTENYDGSPFDCQTCHLGDGYTFAEETCADCHSAAEAAFIAEHILAFGSNCLGCHDGTGRLANFDHAQFFVLDGAHASVECAACHVDRRFKGTPTECVACHAEPEVHVGLLGTDCATCHSTTAWTPARLENHTFPLDHGAEDEEIATCATCHPNTFQEYTCYGCHKHQPDKMAKHHAEKGIFEPQLSNCAVCHPRGDKEEDDEGDDD
jgi:hypothetical protein